MPNGRPPTFYLGNYLTFRTTKLYTSLVHVTSFSHHDCCEHLVGARGLSMARKVERCQTSFSLANNTTSMATIFMII